MSQKKVYYILKSLGGRATLSKINEEIRIKYPDASLWQYASHQVRKLQKKGILDFDVEKKEWVILSDLE